jgi:hypothetical protein
MELEITMLSEISQTKKDNYYKRTFSESRLKKTNKNEWYEGKINGGTVWEWELAEGGQ